MLTREEIIRYHAKTDVPSRYHGEGIELELFATDPHGRIVPYHSARGPSIEKVFNYLVAHRGWKKIDPKKTFGVEKNGRKITVEPGGQIEIVSHIHEYPSDLVQDFLSFLNVLKDIQQHCGIFFLNAAYSPCVGADTIPTIKKSRYQFMEKYFKTTGKLGKEMMKATTSLQIAFDYVSVPDMEAKVNRLLLIKPILSRLSANSRILNGTDSGVHSYRQIVWGNTDPPRCGTPGPETIWKKGKWTLNDYVEKILDAPVMFDVVGKKYAPVRHIPFRARMRRANLEGYIFHNNTAFPDIRIKQYIELRYLDNPGIALVPGMILLLYALVYDDEIWKKFKRIIPYRFADVPRIANLLNKTSKESDVYWNKKIQKPLVQFLNQYKTHIGKEMGKHITPLIAKTISPNKETQKNLSLDCKKIIAYYRNTFIRETNNVLHQR